MKRLLLGLLLVGGLALATASSAFAVEHIRVRLQPVGGSGVTGEVNLVEMPRGGTRINVVARGLDPGDTYLSLYYENHDCALEPDSLDDMIGGTYDANAAGIGVTRGLADEDLDEINSISVRYADTLELLACADVHP